MKSTTPSRAPRAAHALLLLSLVAAGCASPRPAPAPSGGESVAQAPVPGPHSVPAPLEPVVETLDNGLQLVTLVDDSAPLVAVQLWYHVGARDERLDRRGFAHLFEHMMFRGTPRLGPAEHMDLIRATGGDVNAWTSFDETVYVQQVPADQLELVFWLESERMAFLRIDQEGFDKERQVVAEEVRATAEQPYGTVAERLLPQVFDGGTYSWLPGGNLDELERADIAELQAFWERYYVPNNATLVVVGDVDPAEVRALAERYFGFIPRYDDKPAPAVETKPVPQAPRQIHIEEARGPAPVVGLAWRTVAAGHPDEVALDVLATLLGGDPSSRLYARLVVEEERAMVALAASVVLGGDGVFAAGAVLAPLLSDADATLAAMREELARMREHGPTPEELDKARNQALRAAVGEQLTAKSKASLLGRAAVVYGDVEHANRVLSQIEAVSAEDVQRVARTWLSPEREMEIRVEPNMLGFLLGDASETETGTETRTETRTEIDVDSEIAAAPEAPAPQTWGKPGLTRPTSLPESPPLAPPVAPSFEGVTVAHEETLDNGLRVVVVSNHEVPWVNLLLAVPYGAASDPQAAPGTASMAASMLARGTASHAYEALTAELGARAISLGASADMDATMIQASAVTTQTPRALELMASAAREPAFEASQLELLRDQLRTGRAVAEQSPSYVADKALREALYGVAGHPYAREATPGSTELDAITREHLAAWWTAHVRPDTATLYIAGDLEPAQAVALAREHFGQWAAPQDAPPAALEAPAVAAAPTRILLVDRPGEQAQIRIAAPSAVTRKHPDWSASRVLSQIFGGGGLSSRLNQRIRSDEGLTYGAYGGFGARRLGGEFKVSTFSKVASAAETVALILEEIERLRSEAPSAEELTLAQRYLLGSFVLSHETPGAVVEEHWLLDVHDLPRDYMARLLEGVQATQAPALQELAAAHIDPAALTIVVVGPAAELQAALEAIAPVTLVEAE